MFRTKLRPAGYLTWRAIPLDHGILQGEAHDMQSTTTAPRVGGQTYVGDLCWESPGADRRGQAPTRLH